VLVDRKVIVDTLQGIVRNEHPWIREYFHGARGRVAGAGNGEGSPRGT
jgi:phospholipid/cholesterol/gamma-HCH transport system ATP-binding protein